MKKTFVLFKKNDAVVFVNQRPAFVKKGEVLLENPDLSRVQGISPHYWKLVGDNLVFPMNAAEREIKHISHRGHYRALKGFNFKRIAFRLLLSVGFLVVGGITVYFLMKTGRIK